MHAAHSVKSHYIKREGPAVDTEEAQGIVGSERLSELDALRGFALLGILTVNVWYFADPWTIAGEFSPDFTDDGDRAVRFLVAMLFEAKFYLLFSFLFGYSFVLQWDSARRESLSAVPRTLRRLGGLAVIGLAHGLLLYYGDILLTYALIGLVLLATRGTDPRTAAVTGFTITAVLGGFLLLAGLTAALLPLDQPASPAPDVEALTGSPAGAFTANLAHYLTALPAVMFIQGPLALAMFYLGLAAGKRRLLEEPISTELLRNTAIICVPVGLLTAGLQAYLITYVDRSAFGVLSAGISTLTAPILTTGYVCLLLLLFRRASGRRVRNSLASAGRMALTNYLTQSVALAFVFTGYGLGLANLLPPAAVLGGAVVLFALQLVLSAIWLRRFRHGPVEWALRRVTYWSGAGY